MHLISYCGWSLAALEQTVCAFFLEGHKYRYFYC